MGSEMCIRDSHDAMSVLDRINKHLPLKPTSVGDPDIYLGAKLRETQLPMARFSKFGAVVFTYSR